VAVAAEVVIIFSFKSVDSGDFLVSSLIHTTTSFSERNFFLSVFIFRTKRLAHFIWLLLPTKNTYVVGGLFSLCLHYHYYIFSVWKFTKSASVAFRREKSYTKKARLTRIWRRKKKERKIFIAGTPPSFKLIFFVHSNKILFWKMYAISCTMCSFGLLPP